MKWQPSKDRPPKEGNYYLIWDGNSIQKAEYVFYGDGYHGDGYKWEDSRGDYLDLTEVIDYMDLPDPPKRN